MAVVIIGAGPAGLTAAATLARSGAEVVVLDREAIAGGIPRHSAHVGFGRRDVHRFESGPSYARRLTWNAVEAGAHVELNATVTGWDGPRSIAVTAPSGRRTIEADVVILATGARERPRAARLIPGDRPSGIYTTGQLQQLVARGAPVGTRAVVVGAEAVSWSAVLTLRHAGVRTVLMTTEHRTPPAYATLTLAARAALRVPISTDTRLARIIGRDRVTAVEIVDGRSGARRTVNCDTVVFTADWIPDHELARAHGIELDHGTLGPLVDPAWRTTAPGVFAIGNLVHPVDTADQAALDGRSVAASVLEWLAGERETPAQVRLRPGPGLRWITPGRVAAPPAAFSAWTDHAIRRPQLVVEQDGRVVFTQRHRRAVGPGRVLHLPGALAATLDLARGDATVSLLG